MCVQVKQNQDADYADTSSSTLEASRDGDATTATKTRDGARETSRSDTLHVPRLTSRSRTRSRSYSRSVKDEGQVSTSTTALPITDTNGAPASQAPQDLASSILNPDAIPPGATVIGNTIIPATETTSTRPTAGGIAYPFKLKVADAEDVRSSGASVLTLESAVRPVSPMLAPEINKEGELSNGIETPGVVGAEEKVGLERPPGPERFETARETL